jgi:hypothetical protein
VHRLPPFLNQRYPKVSRLPLWYKYQFVRKETKWERARDRRLEPVNEVAVRVLMAVLLGIADPKPLMK